MFLLSALLIISNYSWGKLRLKNYELVDKRNLGFTIKIISPKINIERYFQKEDLKRIYLRINKYIFTKCIN